MSSRVVYTSVFGNYDNIVEQKLPNNWDWKIFSEDNSLPLYVDNNRNAKKFKVLPHRYLSEYEYSIFIDGNMTVIGNINELVELPGVGRKTANVLLGTYYNIPSIVVDTHVTRIVNLLGFCKTRNAVIIERELSKIINKKHWVKFTHLIFDHGRKVCIANRPKCEECIIKDLCPSAIK